MFPTTKCWLNFSIFGPSDCHLVPSGSWVIAPVLQLIVPCCLPLFIWLLICHPGETCSISKTCFTVLASLSHLTCPSSLAWPASPARWAQPVLPAHTRQLASRSLSLTWPNSSACFCSASSVHFHRPCSSAQLFFKGFEDSSFCKASGLLGNLLLDILRLAISPLSQPHVPTSIAPLVFRYLLIESIPALLSIAVHLVNVPRRMEGVY